MQVKMDSSRGQAKTFSEKSYWTKRRYARRQLQMLQQESQDGSSDELAEPVEMSHTKKPKELGQVKEVGEMLQTLEKHRVNSEGAGVEAGIGSGQQHSEPDADSEAEMLSDSDDIFHRFSSDSESSGPDSDFEDEVPDLKKELIQWAVDCQVNQTTVSALLRILKRHHPSLPLDARTLFKLVGSNALQPKSVPGGQYIHYGILNGFLLKMSEIPSNSHSLSLQINVDGLPLFKSSNCQIWPILALINEIPGKTEPVVVGIFCGQSKPKNVTSFLSDFVKEAKELEVNGARIHGKEYQISIQCFICDAPARSFLKCTKSHNGYYGCDRCCQKGEYDKCVVFPLTDSEARTDAKFKQMLYEDHQLQPSPLAELSIGLVSGFVLDYMHLVCF